MNDMNGMNGMDGMMPEGLEGMEGMEGLMPEDMEGMNGMISEDTEGMEGLVQPDSIITDENGDMTFIGEDGDALRFDADGNLIGGGQPDGAEAPAENGDVPQ